MKASLPLGKNYTLSICIDKEEVAHLVVWDKNEAKEDRIHLFWRFLYRCLITWQLTLLSFLVMVNFKYSFLVAYALLGVLVVVYANMIKPYADAADFRKMIRSNKWFPETL